MNDPFKETKQMLQEAEQSERQFKRLIFAHACHAEGLKAMSLTIRELEYRAWGNFQNGSGI